jgi:hypothetical protein
MVRLGQMPLLTVKIFAQAAPPTKAKAPPKDTYDVPCPKEGRALHGIGGKDAIRVPEETGCIDRAILDSPTLQRLGVADRVLEHAHGAGWSALPDDRFEAAFLEERTRDGHARLAKAKTAAEEKAANRVIDEAERAAKKDLAHIPGFYDRDNRVIRMREDRATPEVALHERLHSLSQGIGPFGGLSEGITQYFTEKVLAEQKLPKGKAYPDQLAAARALVALVGDEVVAKAYFDGDPKTLFAAIRAAKPGFDAAAFAKGIAARDWDAVRKVLEP